MNRPWRLRAEYLGLVAILLLALGLRTYHFQLGGFGSEYYSAAVLSMSQSAHNFFFDSFDPAGFITIDKPPLALWVQCLFVSLFGLSGPSILLPQVLEGLGAIILVYVLVARTFGYREALCASLFLAISPVNVAVDRSSNLESGLALVLLFAVAALLKAQESGRGRYFLLSMVLVGVAFNVKFLAGWVIAPALLLVYLAGTAAPIRSRLGYGLLGMALLLGSSLVWIVSFDLQAPSSRPHVAKTVHNSMAELAFATYGVEVLEGRGSEVNLVQNADPEHARSPFFDDVDPGVARLVDRHLAGQVSWFLPLAVLGALLGLGFSGLSQRKRWNLAVWVGWSVLYGLAFAYDRGTFHGYYLAVLGPPLAVLAGVGLVRVVDARTGPLRWLVVSLAITAAWQFYIETEAGVHFRWIRIVLIAGVLISLVALLLSEGPRRVALGVTVASLVIAPTAWALSSVTVLRVNTLIPSADILRLAGVARNPIEYASSGYGVATDDPKLYAYLQAHRAGETFLIATPNARLAAPIILHTGLPALAIGGFSGQDRILSADDLISMARSGQVRYVLLGDDLAFGSGSQGRERAHQFLDKAREVGRRVEPSEWRTPRTPLSELLESAEPLRLQGARMQLYDLRPDDPR